MVTIHLLKEAQKSVFFCSLAVKKKKMHNMYFF